jgi:hypothetical protein
MQARSAHRSTLPVVVCHSPIVDRRDMHCTDAASAARLDAARPLPCPYTAPGARHRAGVPLPARERARRRAGQLAWRAGQRPCAPVVWGELARTHARADGSWGAQAALPTGNEEPRPMAAFCSSAESQQSSVSWSPPPHPSPSRVPPWEVH